LWLGRFLGWGVFGSGSEGRWVSQFNAWAKAQAYLRGKGKGKNKSKVRADYIPTHAAIKPRHGWGTCEISGGCCPSGLILEKLFVTSK
jgi:hypothetical protein